MYSHQYLIGRKEAKEDLGIKTINYADNELSKAINELFEEYQKEMELNKIWNPEVEIDQNQAVTKKEYKIAFVESVQQTDCFKLVVEYKKGQVQITQQTPQGPIQIPQEKVMWKIIEQGWK